ncbi:TPA: hypothetical protein GE536_16230 [Escherichia coli]|nr:hypothetical protein CIC18_02200 [Escherichia coli]HAH3824440.1 hypothetical protein [Escherichia coli]
MRWSAEGINLLEYSPQPAVRCVMVLSAPGYTLLCCCFLSGLYTLMKPIVFAVSNPFALCLPFGLLTTAVSLCGSAQCYR